jgi:hypothetical protein
MLAGKSLQGSRGRTEQECSAGAGQMLDVGQRNSAPALTLPRLSAGTGQMLNVGKKDELTCFYVSKSVMNAAASCASKKYDRRRGALL